MLYICYIYNIYVLFPNRRRIASQIAKTVDWSRLIFMYNMYRLTTLKMFFARILTIPRAYVKRPGIVPIPREEKGLPNDAMQVDEEEEKIVRDDIADKEQLASQPVEENRHRMTLRSHTKAMEH